MQARIPVAAPPGSTRQCAISFEPLFRSSKEAVNLLSRSRTRKRHSLGAGAALGDHQGADRLDGAVPALRRTAGPAGLRGPGGADGVQRVGLSLPAIGVTLDQREATPFWGTSGMGTWTRLAGQWLLLSRKTCHMPISEYDEPVARSSTTSDVFNAIGDVRRREILDALITGEKTVGAIVNDLSMSQPQVSKHLRVLSEVGLVRCRAEGRRRLYRLEPEHLRPLHEWVVKYEQAWNDRMDRLDDYLQELQQQGELQ
jgi:DNA-binding transcriptional ArsR family regulator